MQPATRNSGSRRLAFGLGILALGLAFATAPARAQITAAEDPRPFIVKMHATWCGTCAALEPTWKRIQAEYGSRARLVVFDVSDKKSLEQSRAAAEVLGLTSFFNKYKGNTGTIAVLRANRVPVAVMTGELDLAAYDEAIAKALVPNAS
jgi:thiol-disulfide isomerase/thioredoxin